jgi:putative transposase
MSQEAHVRFWESAGVQLPRATHLLVLSECHLRRILARYFSYYHGARTHLALQKDAPDGRPIERPAMGPVISLPEVGGLHHRYVRQAA